MRDAVDITNDPAFANPPIRLSGRDTSFDIPFLFYSEGGESHTRSAACKLQGFLVS
jgi:hypothetical protein